MPMILIDVFSFDFMSNNSPMCMHIYGISFTCFTGWLLLRIFNRRQFDVLNNSLPKALKKDQEFNQLANQTMLTFNIFENPRGKPVDASETGMIR